MRAIWMMSVVLWVGSCGISETEPVGEVRLPLETATPAGNVYRLDDAVFEIKRTTEMVTVDETNLAEP